MEHFLAALNAFFKSNGDDCRGQVCHLGESVFPCLLTMWKRTQGVNSSFKVQCLNLISYSPYCLPYNSCDVSSENLILDQLIIFYLIFFFILITCLLVINYKEKLFLDHLWELKG